LPWFAKGIALLEPEVAREPKLLVERRYLRTNYWGRALALDQLGRRAEALRDWDRAVMMSTAAEKPQIQMPRAASLAGAGRHAEAVAEANRLLDGATPGIIYDAACVHSLASATVKDDPAVDAAKLAEEYAARAVELLYKAKAAGWFRNRAMIEYIRTDNDLQPLQMRADYKKFIAELESGASDRQP
jgi:hypothetical protein